MYKDKKSENVIDIKQTGTPTVSRLGEFGPRSAKSNLSDCSDSSKMSLAEFE